MLAQIRGTILKKLPGKVLLGVGPITLEILIPFSLFERLPEEGRPFSFYVVLRLRGEVFELYGFEDWETREVFQRLQSIPRVGPRLALNILSVFTPHEFRQIIEETDIERLSRVPGIGPKRAERLCVELRARLGLVKKTPTRREKSFEEALSALLNLGFSAGEASNALEAVYQEDDDLALLIRKALKRLSGHLQGG